MVSLTFGMPHFGRIVRTHDPTTAIHKMICHHMENSRFLLRAMEKKERDIHAYLTHLPPPQQNAP